MRKLNKVILLSTILILGLLALVSIDIKALNKKDASGYIQAYNHKPSNILDNVFVSNNLTILPFILEDAKQTIQKSYVKDQFVLAGETILNEIELKDIIVTGDIIKTNLKTYTVVIYGDVDANGKITVHDAQCAFDSWYNKEEFSNVGFKLAANVYNDNDKITVYDAQTIFDFWMGSNKKLVLNEPVSLAEKDNEAPIITLKGANPQIIKYGENYIELGATATDNIDKNVIVTINADAVKTNELNTFYVTYTAQDAKGNTAEVKRAVIIKDYIKGIELNSAPTKTEYENGTNIDISGGKINVIYSSGKKVATNIDAASISGYNANTAGTQTITVTYSTNDTIDDTTKDFATSFEVIVKEKQSQTTPNPEDPTPGPGGQEDPVDPTEPELKVENITAQIVQPQDNYYVNKAIKISVKSGEEEAKINPSDLEWEVIDENNTILDLENTQIVEVEQIGEQQEDGTIFVNFIAKQEGLYTIKPKVGEANTTTITIDAKIKVSQIKLEGVTDSIITVREKQNISLAVIFLDEEGRKIEGGIFQNRVTKEITPENTNKVEVRLLNGASQAQQATDKVTNIHLKGVSQSEENEEIVLTIKVDNDENTKMEVKIVVTEEAKPEISISKSDIILYLNQLENKNEYEELYVESGNFLVYTLVPVKLKIEDEEKTLTPEDGKKLSVIIEDFILESDDENISEKDYIFVQLYDEDKNRVELTQKDVAYIGIGLSLYGEDYEKEDLSVLEALKQKGLTIIYNGVTVSKYNIAKVIVTPKPEIIIP